MLRWMCACCALSSSLLACPALVWAESPPEPQDLFDGKSLEGWNGNTEYWSVVDGNITGVIPEGATLDHNEFLFWNGEVADFRLTLEFRIGGDPTANSGIQFRSEKHPGGGAEGYQADLDDGAVWLGRIYDEEGRGLLVERGTRVSISPDGKKWVDPHPFANPEDYTALAKPGEWSTYQIDATGAHVEVRVNDKLCSVLDDNQTDAADFSGLLGLQLHGGPGPVKVEYRNIQLTDLGETKTPEPVSQAPQPSKVIPENLQPAVQANLNRLQESPVLWQLHPNPATQLPVGNAEAQSVVADMQVMPGFQVELIAAEPTIHQPIAFAMDDRGRLWIAEAHSYPSKRPEGEGEDRIVILEDTDGDGQFETSKVFIEGLNLVSGLEVGMGGIWVGAAPQLLFIPDANHDDQPDADPQVLLDGWGYQDTHETLNSLTWGPDGWLYGIQGVFTKSFIGKPGAPEDERVSLNAGVWRYHPTRHEFEIFASGGSNPWGLDFNSAGHFFMTHCRSYWGGGNTTYVIRNGHFWNQTNSGYAPFVSNAGPNFAPRLKNYLPASAKYGSGEGGAGKPGTRAVYGGHSHVGTLLYQADNWPTIYYDHLFTHNLHGHQMNHQHNVREGSGYETLHGGFDMLLTPHPAYVAVDLQTGPDGAVYMSDWVDIEHCHNPHIERWDRTNGRMYRMSWAETYQPVQVNLLEMSDTELAELQTHPNNWYSRHARQLLQERATQRAIDEQAIARLKELFHDATGYASALRPLWALHVTGQLDQETINQALQHSSEYVRAWGVQLATDNSQDPQIAPRRLRALALDDPSAVVRLAVASALPTIAESNRWPVINALASHGEDASDRFLPDMIWFGIGEMPGLSYQLAFDHLRDCNLRTLYDSLTWYSARSDEGRAALCQEILKQNEQSAERLLKLMAFSLATESTLPQPPAWPQVVAKLSKSSGTAGELNLLSAMFGDEQVLTETRNLLADRKAPIAARQQALQLLSRVGDRQATAVYFDLLSDPGFRSAVIPLLSRSEDPDVATQLLTIYPQLSPEDRQAALNTLTSRPTLALALLHAVQEGKFEKSQLTAFQIRQLRELHQPEVDQLTDELFGTLTESSAEVKAHIARLKHAYHEAPLWAFDVNGGRRVFEKTCAACHTMNGTGGQLGPDLSAAWRNGPDYFIDNILDPNAVVGEAFQLTIIARGDGTVVSGILSEETDSAVTLRTEKELVTIPRADIDVMRTTKQSFMPNGILDPLSSVETIELLKFLSSPK